MSLTTDWPLADVNKMVESAVEAHQGILAFSLYENGSSSGSQAVIDPGRGGQELARPARISPRDRTPRCPGADHSAAVLARGQSFQSKFAMRSWNWGQSIACHSRTRPPPSA